MFGNVYPIRKIDELPKEDFFRGWRIDHDLTGTWKAECPDWGVSLEAKSFRGLVSKMKKAGDRYADV